MTASTEDRVAFVRAAGGQVTNRMALALCDDVERLASSLSLAASRRPRALAMMGEQGFVFLTPLNKRDDERTEAERWENLAFSLYNDLCVIELLADTALADRACMKCGGHATASVCDRCCA